MNHNRQKYREYREENQNERQKSFELVEYPELKEYYSNNIHKGYKKPRKIIVTEIYDEIIPKCQNGIQRKEYFNYYTQSHSPYNNFQGYKNIGQKKLFSQNKNIYLTERKDMNFKSINKGLASDYDKKLYFGRTDLRDEYSTPSNNRVEIRKKVYRGSYTPTPIRNKLDLSNEEDFIENFGYYESKNIKDKTNKKYDSITRVTGYSSLVPLSNRKIEYNQNEFNKIALYKYNNSNNELAHNYSNIDIYKNNFKSRFEMEQKPQKEEKIKEVEIIKKYEIEKKVPQKAIKNTTTQFQTSKRKYESTKMPQISTKTTNIQAQSSKKKYESFKSPETVSKTTVTTTTKRKYESSKPQTITKTTNISNISNIQTKNSTKKYEIQKKELASKNAKSQSKQFKYIKKDIDMSKYKRDNSCKLVFKAGGERYRYKENLSEKDIINSRKNEQNKNIKRLSIVEENSKKDSKKVSLSKTNSTKVSNINSSLTYKKVEQSTKNAINKNINKTNLTNAAASRNLKETKITTTKSTTNAKSAINKFVSNKEVKKPATSSFKTNITTKINIQKFNTGFNNKRNDNSVNLSNIAKKNQETNIQINTQKKEGLDINKYRRDIINMEEQRKKISSQQYLTNIDSSAKIYDTINNISNIGYIENREIHEMKKNKKKELTPKTKTKILGDNYKYYESKCTQIPGEIATTNSYTLHQRRNERVIYGEVYEDYEDNKMKSYKTKSGKKGTKKKHKKMMKKKKIPMESGENNYVVYSKYCQDYNYTDGRGGEEFEYENDEEFNGYPQGMIYYP